MRVDLANALTQDLITTPVDTPSGWCGRWVADRLGLSLSTTYSAYGSDLTDLVGLAVRRNPRRAHLLVSTVLGKHVPTDPRVVYGSGALLGQLVADSLDMASLGGSTVCPPGTAVVGFAETATALGHVVANVLHAPYIHSTRRRVPGVLAVGAFEEEHSHATSHILLPADPDFFATTGPLVLVDDELSTGQTALNTIMAMQAAYPRSRYVIAALVDLRSAEDRRRMAAVAANLGVAIGVVALAAGTLELPADVLALGSSLVAARDAADEISRDSGTDDALPDPGCEPPVTLAWPTGLHESGRHGFAPADMQGLVNATTAAAADLVHSFAGGDILVLGHEELMYAPLNLALGLVDQVPSGARVRFSTTTRSPVLAVDDPGYAVRTKLTFPAHDDPADGPGERYAYNVAPGVDASRRFSDIVLVIDTPADTPALRQPAGLLSVLHGVCDRVHLVVIPALLPATPGIPRRDRQ